MKLTAISDMHGYLPPIPQTDILIVAGDSCPVYASHGAGVQMKWWDVAFGPWLAGIHASYKIVVAGNHDYAPLMYPEEMKRWARKWTSNGYGKVTFLQDELAVPFGIPVYGYCHVPDLKGWAFYSSENDLRKAAYAIPERTEILVTHVPPQGMGDKAWKNDPRSFRHTGDGPLREAIVNGHLPNLKLHIFGHIHEARGQWGLPFKDAIHYNVSHLDRTYEIPQPLVQFEKRNGKYSVLDVNKQLEGWPDE